MGGGDDVTLLRGVLVGHVDQHARKAQPLPFAGGGPEGGGGRQLYGRMTGGWPSQP